MLNAAASVASRIVTQSKHVASAGTPGPVVFQSAMKTLSVRLSPGSQMDQMPGLSVAVTYVDLKMTRAKSTEKVGLSRIVSAREKATCEELTSPRSTEERYDGLGHIGIRS